MSDDVNMEKEFIVLCRNDVALVISEYSNQPIFVHFDRR